MRSHGDTDSADVITLFNGTIGRHPRLQQTQSDVASQRSRNSQIQLDGCVVIVPKPVVCLQDVASANGSNLKLRLGAFGFILPDIMPARINILKLGSI